MLLQPILVICSYHILLYCNMQQDSGHGIDLKCLILFYYILIERFRV